ncbi:MAG: hypothetical protein GY952_00615 [Rhodobacteraceae bacterium]|nr:hypothetical protein [Paracoccaceae bacterium]
MADYPKFPAGLHLIARWKAGDAEAREELRQIFDDTIEGKMDAEFATPAPVDRVHVSASIHMLALAILHDLYGIDSAAYYKGDSQRYARTNLITSRLVGVDKVYTAWALYGFTCEQVGQKMMYPDRFPPGSDPDEPLINRDNWRDLRTPDFDTGVAKIITGILAETERLTGMEPLLQISAPYSFAADIYGQEPLLADVVHDPEFVNELLDFLADTVLTPWIEHFVERFPNGWIELSDASGSPFFIGPDNCKNMAIRSMRRMAEGKEWGDRLFDCNYRGDHVATVAKRDRGGRRRGANNADNTPKVGLRELTDHKHMVCPKFIMRLEADKVEVPFYVDQAVQRGVPLTTGVGSCQIDANSVGDLAAAKVEIKDIAEAFVAAQKEVASKVEMPEDRFRAQPWPSHVYFEDVAAESQFEMMEIIIRTVREQGTFK